MLALVALSAALALVRPSWTSPPRPYRAPLALYTSDACVGHQPSSRTKPHPEQPERTVTGVELGLAHLAQRIEAP